MSQRLWAGKRKICEFVDALGGGVSAMDDK